MATYNRGQITVLLEEEERKEIREYAGAMQEYARLFKIWQRGAPEVFARWVGAAVCTTDGEEPSMYRVPEAIKPPRRPYVKLRLNMIRVALGRLAMMRVGKQGQVTIGPKDVIWDLVGSQLVAGGKTG